MLLVVLLWGSEPACAAPRAAPSALPDLTPAMQVLAAKLARIVLLTLAVALVLGAVGIDLTAFAVFSGAIGVGIGFGLQKVVSNPVSGVILLLDRSIKPGDAIEIEYTYGWITRMNARYVSVVTRDGTEYLIPNEDLIIQRVTNWKSDSNDLVRLHVPIGVAYGADLRQALCACAGCRLRRTARAHRAQAGLPGHCLRRERGQSRISASGFQTRATARPMCGGEVMLKSGTCYKARGIEAALPQL